MRRVEVTRVWPQLKFPTSAILSASFDSPLSSSTTPFFTLPVQCLYIVNKSVPSVSPFLLSISFAADRCMPRGKSGPKDQVALHYYYTSPSHWCTTHEVSKL